MSNADSPTPCSWASSLLDPVDEAGLRAHLTACPYCRNEVDWDERLTRQLRAAPSPPVPPGIASRVRRRLWRRHIVRAGAAAAVFLAAGLLWSRWPRLPDTERAEDPPAVADLPGSSVLFAGPPVDGLDVLARQQSAYLSALGQAEEKP
jgi:hypothetical protein